ncbi:putative post-transcriptional gene silencing PAZ-Argonaute family protein [Helianthus annuus]|nr:putative post-transcriptional gene silencing PAZ-Argonaute family protein [Helianthus annuus]
MSRAAIASSATHTLSLSTLNFLSLKIFIRSSSATHALSLSTLHFLSLKIFIKHFLIHHSLHSRVSSSTFHFSFFAERDTSSRKTKMTEAESKALPPSPPKHIPSGSNRSPMARRGSGTKGQKIQLVTNHFNVKFSSTTDHFYQYSVALFYEDGTPVEAKGVGRRVLDMLYTLYSSEMGGKGFAYDGEKTLFTMSPLRGTKLEFPVLLENLSSNRDAKRSRRPPQSKSYNVKINYATKIPIQAIFNALRGHDSEQFHEAVRVLDIMLRQHAAKQGCLLVKQSFFHNDPRNSISIGGGVVGCRGFHSSFRATQAGLSLNMDVSTTMIVRPGKVVDFLLENQNAKSIRDIDWMKAKRMLKNLRVKTFPSNLEYKIIGLSEKPCRQQMFLMKQRNADSPSDPIEITVSDYYAKYRNQELIMSHDYPCLDVGKPKRPVYIPLELCELISLQRYTKALSSLQRAKLVEQSRQKPKDRMNCLMDQLKRSNYTADPLINSTGITINTACTQVEGRVLEPPKLKFGNGGDLVPRGGRWNFNNKTLVEPTAVTRWAVVNFSARCDTNSLCRDLLRCCKAKGMNLEAPHSVIQENHQSSRNPAPARVELMFEAIKQTLPGPPRFLLCILPERKNSGIYGPWKRKCLVENGIVTQCIAPTRINDQYLTNLLLKINAKMGGLNSVLSVEHLHSIPMVSRIPTIIIGMDVSHGSPGRSDVPSIAAVVSSRKWPLISQYRASVRAQSARCEMIDALFKPVSPNEDEGMIRELLVDFYQSTPKLKPAHMIIFRDGVSESQFDQVLNIELEQIMQACKYLDDNDWNPKFLVIVAQKAHHTRFFQPRSDANVPPGTIVDTKVGHPKNYDFYLCAQNGPIGTTRPTHYHVLLDQIGFSPDDLQELVHSLSYVYQRSTSAISVVAPICYAHLAAAQMSQFVKFEDMSDTASSHSGGGGAGSSSGGGGFTQIPKLHENVCSSMFFC